MYAIEMASCSITYTPSFTKTGTGVQAIFRFCFRNLRGCNVDTTDARDSWIIAVEMPSEVKIHIPNFIKTDSVIQKLMQGIHIQTQTAK
jgi:hypothetical protein